MKGLDELDQLNKIETQIQRADKEQWNMQDDSRLMSQLRSYINQKEQLIRFLKSLTWAEQRRLQRKNESLLNWITIEDEHSIIRTIPRDIVQLLNTLLDKPEDDYTLNKLRQTAEIKDVKKIIQLFPELKNKIELPKGSKTSIESPYFVYDKFIGKILSETNGKLNVEIYMTNVDGDFPIKMTIPTPQFKFHRVKLTPDIKHNIKQQWLVSKFNKMTDQLDIKYFKNIEYHSVGNVSGISVPFKDNNVVKQDITDSLNRINSKSKDKFQFKFDNDKLKLWINK